MGKIEEPLSNINGNIDKQIVWNVVMPDEPGVPELDLLPNFKRLKRFAKLAGVKQLTIESRDGYKSIFESSTEEIDADGSIDSSNDGLLIYAEPMSHTTVTNIRSYGTDDCTDFHWTNSTIAINMSELKDRAIRVARNDQELTERSLWAHLLNIAVADGIYDAAKQNMISKERVSKLSQGLFGAAVLEFACVTIADLTILNPIQATAWLTGLVTLTQVGNILAGLGNRNRLGDFRISVVPGKNYDRVLASLVMPRLFKVVKAA